MCVTFNPEDKQNEPRKAVELDASLVHVRK